MAEQPVETPPRDAPAPVRRRPLPAPVRYLIIAAFGSAIAMLGSYLLRTIGY